MAKISSFLLRDSNYGNLIKHANQRTTGEVAFQNLISVATVISVTTAISIQISKSAQDSYSISVAYLHYTYSSEHDTA